MCAGELGSAPCAPTAIYHTTFRGDVDAFRFFEGFGVDGYKYAVSVLLGRIPYPAVGTLGDTLHVYVRDALNDSVGIDIDD